MTFGSLFAGIGGFDLGFERAGMECRWQVEIDPFCRKVLTKHWPHVPKFEDVREFAKEYDENLRVDCICGGFPCQDISVAGTGAGLDGERSGLWSDYLRIIRTLRPRFVVVENSAAILFRGIGRVLGDLARSGFDAEWRVFSAYEFGAPHERERVYIVAYANEVNGEAGVGTQQNRTGAIFNGSLPTRLPFWLQATSEFIGMDAGISARAYQDRVGAIGNAVVPQISEWIARRIVAQ